MTFETIQPGQTFKCRSGRNPSVIYTVVRKTAKRIVYGWNLSDVQWSVAPTTFFKDFAEA
jgi:hypothetical protein